MRDKLESALFFCVLRLALAFAGLSHLLPVPEMPWLAWQSAEEHSHEGAGSWYRS